MDYLLHHPGSNVNLVEFDKECGVGVVVTAEEINDVVRVIISFCFTITLVCWFFDYELWIIWIVIFLFLLVILVGQRFSQKPKVPSFQIGCR